MSTIQIWQGPNGIELPSSINDPKDILPFATYLTERQQNQIISAFQVQAYDMAAEYAWKKAMVKLKDTIATLGMQFIGEMLNRPDIDDSIPIDAAITDYYAIQLAEQLGVIGKTAALRLRQSNELITHYFSKNADEELDLSTAFSIVKSSVQYILGEQDISIAIEFSNFRERLLNESLKLDDAQVEQIITSPLFYLRTVITILISSIKTDVGAKLEHALANLNLLTPHIWKNLGENDKWNIGMAYRDVTAAGNSIAISGIKSALLKVSGFDYVPENLRSMTFIKSAKQVLEIHYAYNNFYNEPAAIKRLINLGTTIPAPALTHCIQAYLAVYLGNYYGHSNAAAPLAFAELSKLSEERWRYYFEKIIHTDDVVLQKMYPNQVLRFKHLLDSNNLTHFEGLPRKNQTLYNAIVLNNGIKAKQIATDLYEKIAI